MKTTVCLSADSINYPEGGGHFWVYLNWALGLKSNGYEVIWLEGIAPEMTEQARANVTILQGRLEKYGLGGSLALCCRTATGTLAGVPEGCLSLHAAAERADLLLNLRYTTSPAVVSRFSRSALVDIDPGLLQIWLSEGTITIARHDIYFSIGETVGQAGAKFPGGGIAWHYTPPCVSAADWPVSKAGADGRFTTISTWWAEEWMEYGGELYRNDKRSGFEGYFDLPGQTTAPLELALCMAANEHKERAWLEGLGWRIRDSAAVSSTPWEYQHYIQDSRGEFSCAKPSCVRLQNAWISDRTLCFLASGKPAIVQHTGPSRSLPDAAGLFRFTSLEEAAQMLDTVQADYERQCRLARELAEAHFDARAVTRRVVELGLASSARGEKTL